MLCQGANTAAAVGITEARKLYLLCLLCQDLKAKAAINIFPYQAGPGLAVFKEHKNTPFRTTTPRIHSEPSYWPCWLGKFGELQSKRQSSQAQYVSRLGDLPKYAPKSNCKLPMNGKSTSAVFGTDNFLRSHRPLLNYSQLETPKQGRSFSGRILKPGLASAVIIWMEEIIFPGMLIHIGNIFSNLYSY